MTKGIVLGLEGTSVSLGCKIGDRGFPAIYNSLVTWSVLDNASWTVNNYPHVKLSANHLNLTIENARKGHDVTYVCSVTNAAGLSDSDKVVLLLEGMLS